MALSKGRTAVHGQDLAGDIIGVFAGKEDEGRSDVLRLPEPTQGYAGGSLFQCGVVDFHEAVCHTSVDRAGLTQLTVMRKYLDPSLAADRL